MPDPEIATVNVLMIVSLAEKPASKAADGRCAVKSKRSEERSDLSRNHGEHARLGRGRREKTKIVRFKHPYNERDKQDDRESPDHEFPCMTSDEPAKRF